MLSTIKTFVIALALKLVRVHQGTLADICDRIISERIVKKTRLLVYDYVKNSPNKLDDTLLDFIAPFIVKELSKLKRATATKVAAALRAADERTNIALVNAPGPVGLLQGLKVFSPNNDQSVRLKFMGTQLRYSPIDGSFDFTYGTGPAA